jgi:hypothetical protein
MIARKRDIASEITQGLKEAQAWKRGKLNLQTTPELAAQKGDEAKIRAARKRLKGSVVKYEQPCDPVIDPDS